MHYFCLVNVKLLERTLGPSFFSLEWGLTFTHKRKSLAFRLNFKESFEKSRFKNARERERKKGRFFSRWESINIEAHEVKVHLNDFLAEVISKSDLSFRMEILGQPSFFERSRLTSRIGRSSRRGQS